jgi:phospholipid/cholesterol/gamma-HCH transport system ATP-binding protein
VKVLGKEVPKLSHSGLFELRKQMGVLFQTNALFTDLSVFDNVAFPIREHTRLPESMIHDIVLMKLEAVGLRGTHHLMPSELSGGMARRVALARAIALDPKIMLYDEPFTGQDPISMGVVVKLIKMLNDALGLTSVVVSHDVQEVLSIADYVYIISDAKVIGEGSPDEIRACTEPMVQQFIGGKPDGPVAFHYPAKDRAVDFNIRVAT